MNHLNQINVSCPEIFSVLRKLFFLVQIKMTIFDLLLIYKFYKQFFSNESSNFPTFRNLKLSSMIQIHLEHLDLLL